MWLHEAVRLELWEQRGPPLLEELELAAPLVLREDPLHLGKIRRRVGGERALDVHRGHALEVAGRMQEADEGADVYAPGGSLVDRIAVRIETAKKVEVRLGHSGDSIRR